jgi:hypothetical protein
LQPDVHGRVAGLENRADPHGELLPAGVALPQTGGGWTCRASGQRDRLHRTLDRPVRSAKASPQPRRRWLLRSGTRGGKGWAGSTNLGAQQVPRETVIVTAQVTVRPDWRAGGLCCGALGDAGALGSKSMLDTTSADRFQGVGGPYPPWSNFRSTTSSPFCWRRRRVTRLRWRRCRRALPSWSADLG